MTNHQEKIGRSWDDVSRGNVTRLNWWQIQAIIKHINQHVCGSPIPGFSQGLYQLLQKFTNCKTFQRGISIGCGEGEKEITLIRQGMVEHFDLYEYSDVRIGIGMESARKWEITEKIEYHNVDVFKAGVDKQYDFVHWNNSLHHMFDVDEAVAFSHSILIPGGIFYMDDFVGPSRFQWSDRELDIARDVRGRILKMIQAESSSTDTPFEEAIKRPDPDIDMAYDPSEAADSDRILSSVLKYFPDALVIPTGGVIYQLALQGVLEHIDTSEESSTLKYALEEDDKCIEAGLTHYAVALARKVMPEEI